MRGSVTTNRRGSRKAAWSRHTNISYTTIDFFTPAQYCRYSGCTHLDPKNKGQIYKSCHMNVVTCQSNPMQAYFAIKRPVFFVILQSIISYEIQKEATALNSYKKQFNSHDLLSKTSHTKIQLLFLFHLFCHSNNKKPTVKQTEIFF